MQTSVTNDELNKKEKNVGMKYILYASQIQMRARLFISLFCMQFHIEFYLVLNYFIPKFSYLLTIPLKYYFSSFYSKVMYVYRYALNPIRMYYVPDHVTRVAGFFVSSCVARPRQLQ